MAYAQQPFFVPKDFWNFWNQLWFTNPRKICGWDMKVGAKKVVCKQQHSPTILVLNGQQLLVMLQCCWSQWCCCWSEIRLLPLPAFNSLKCVLWMLASGSRILSCDHVALPEKGCGCCCRLWLTSRSCSWAFITGLSFSAQDWACWQRAGVPWASSPFGGT